MLKQQSSASQVDVYHSDDDNEQEVDLRKPTTSLPFNGLVDEKISRNFAYCKRIPSKGLSKRKIDKREKRNLPITSYLVVGKKKGYLPLCDGKCILNEELISNIRKELHKLMKLSPKLRSQSNLLQPAPLVPLMLDRANRLFEGSCASMPGVEFRGGVEGVRFTVANINLAIKVLNPDLQLEEKVCCLIALSKRFEQCSLESTEAKRAQQRSQWRFRGRGGYRIAVEKVL